MSDDETDIFEILAYKISKRIADTQSIPLDIELVRIVLDELRKFRATSILRIDLNLPEMKEVSEIKKKVIELAKKTSFERLKDRYGSEL